MSGTDETPHESGGPPHPARVFTCENITELYFVLGLLRAEGIDAVTQNESSSWDWFVLPMDERPSILVRDSDQVARAREIVQEYMHHRVEGGPTPTSE